MARHRTQFSCPSRENASCRLPLARVNIRIRRSVQPRARTGAAKYQTGTAMIVWATRGEGRASRPVPPPPRSLWDPGQRDQYSPSEPGSEAISISSGSLPFRLIV